MNVSSNVAAELNEGLNGTLSSAMKLISASVIIINALKWAVNVTIMQHVDHFGEKYGPTVWGNDFVFVLVIKTLISDVHY